MADESIQRLQALEQDNARLRRLLERQGSTAGLRHQVRNTLAMVRNLVRQSVDGYDDAQDYAAHLEGRLDAVFRVQAAIANQLSDGIPLGSLITEELLTHATGEGERLAVSGPETLLPPDVAGAVALAIHELAVNAVKFGALSIPRGRVAVSWTVARDRHGAVLVLRWDESGLTGLKPPARSGFGSEVIERLLGYQFGGEGTLAFAPGGLRCTIRLPLAGGAPASRAGR